ncbi:hypothetical protein Peur_009446 [Populus x canadensis]
MNSLTSRLIHSRTSLSKLYTMAVSSYGRYLSTDSNKVDEPFKVEEAETLNVPPPPTEKSMQLLVLGGNGFVGSHICKEAVDRGLTVASLSRYGDPSKLSGRPSIQESWVNNVIWHQGVKRFVYISAADFGLVNYLLQGYYEGKKAAETELLTKFAYGGVVLRPGFIYGTRNVGSVKLPLGVIGSPLEMLPLVGPLFTPPVNVTVVVKVAVRAATDPVFPPDVMDVYGILHYSQQQRAT